MFTHPDPDSDPLYYSALDLARAMRGGRVDPVEHTERVLQRARDLSGLGAFASLAPEYSLRQARRAAAILRSANTNTAEAHEVVADATPVLNTTKLVPEAARGRRDGVVETSDNRPDLTGVPFPIKDLIAVEGLPLECGTPLLRGNIADHTDGVAANVLAAGTVTIGKTSTPEFGFTGYTEPVGQPPARTPWDLRRTAGGSSGGAAVAVAAGIVPIALGNDGGGSIRIPAAACGVLGIKPGRGLVSSAPGAPGIGLTTPGILSRTVADLAAGLEIIAHVRPGDSFPYPRREHYLADVLRSGARPLEGIRLAILTEPLNVDTDIHPAALAAVDRAARILRAAGASLTRVPRPLTPARWHSAFMPIWKAGAAAMSIPAGQETALTPLTRWLRSEGGRLTGADVVRAQTALQGVGRTMGEAFASFDAVLTPGSGIPPALASWTQVPEDPAEDFRRQCVASPWTSTWNMWGPAAVSVPLHRAEVDGQELPFAVHVGGVRAGQEGLLLRIAAILERADPWPLITIPAGAAL